MPQISPNVPDRIHLVMYLYNHFFFKNSTFLIYYVAGLNPALSYAESFILQLFFPIYFPCITTGLINL